MAIVFLAHKNFGGPKKRALFRMSESDARKFCQDPRTKDVERDKWACHWTNDMGVEGVDYSWIYDMGRFKPVIEELGIKILNRTPPARTVKIVRRKK